MKILFVHQNFPGQFGRLAVALMERGHEVLALTAAGNQRPSTIPTFRYKYEPVAFTSAAHMESTTFAEMTHRGKAAALAAQALRDSANFKPDVVLGHIGWGETLFLKDVWPSCTLIAYAEFCYRARGLDVGFDPEFGASDLMADIRITARSAHLITATALADKALAPTLWQANSFPMALRSKISVIHEGIDCNILKPNDDAFVDAAGQTFRAGDEIVTFVSRNLEPYRGFHIFMRALPEILQVRPKAHVVIIGGDQTSYGPKPGPNKTWKEIFLREVGARLDLSRVHFLGRVDYGTFVALMQISRVHAYLTYPFVLSWSMLEAMACGALVVGSKTPPVEEIITHEKNGLLVDFFDVSALQTTIIQALERPGDYNRLRVAARASILERYDLSSICLPSLIDFVEKRGSL